MTRITNPRYIAWAAYNHRTPKQQLLHDRESGSAYEFSLWLKRQWHRWFDIGDHRKRYWFYEGYDDEAHKLFDAWLHEEFETPQDNHTGVSS